MLKFKRLDGVFLFIDGLLTINDATLHPERQFTGTQALTVGTHSLELYFFENGGEASLEFTLADSSGVFTHFDNPKVKVSVPAPSVLSLMVAGLVGFGFARRRVRG